MRPFALFLSMKIQNLLETVSACSVFLRAYTLQLGEVPSNQCQIFLDLVWEPLSGVMDIRRLQLVRVLTLQRSNSLASNFKQNFYYIVMSMSHSVQHWI